MQAFCNDCERRPKELFGVILTDDMLIEKGFDDARFLEVENGFFVGSTFACRLLFAQFAVNDGLQTRTQESQMKTPAGPAIIFSLPLVVSHKGAEVDFGLAIRLPVQSLGFFDITSSTKPYSLASSADM